MIAFGELPAKWDVRRNRVGGSAGRGHEWFLSVSVRELSSPEAISWRVVWQALVIWMEMDLFQYHCAAVMFCFVQITVNKENQKTGRMFKTIFPYYGEPENVWGPVC